jgi:hypothetical protein
MAFEVFRRRSRPAYSKPSIGVHRRGTVRLNGAALAMLIEASEVPATDIEKVWVQFLYDPENKIVGLRSAAKDTIDSYPLRRMKKSDSYLATGKGFFNYYNLQDATNKRYTPRIYEGGVLGFSVDEGTDAG